MVYFGFFLILVSLHHRPKEYFWKDCSTFSSPSLGPLAIFLSSVPLSISLLWWWLCLPPVLIAFGLFFPNNGFARLSGFSGVFIWLFFGFATAVVRIT